MSNDVKNNESEANEEADTLSDEELAAIAGGASIGLAKVGVGVAASALKLGGVGSAASGNCSETGDTGMMGCPG